MLSIRLRAGRARMSFSVSHPFRKMRGMDGARGIRAEGATCRSLRKVNWGKWTSRLKAPTC
jgi:hypothetical protein